MHQAPAPRSATSGSTDSLRAAATRPRGGGALLLTVPAPRGAAERLWSLSTGPRVFWSSPDGDVVAGVGEAVRLEGRGAARFDEIAASARALWRDAEIWRHPDAPDLPPVLVGGFAFRPLRAADRGWEAWGDARFVLPRWTYRARGDAAALTLAVAAGEDAAEVLGAAPGPAEILAALGRELPDGCLRGRVGGGLDRRRWADLVGDITRRISEGSLRKVVLARRVDLDVDGADPLVTLRHLAATGAGYRFALHTAGTTFLGASPELLVRRRGRVVVSEALAGTVPRTRGAGEDIAVLESGLLGDPKQRAEHALVVDAVRERLGAVCSRIETPDVPEIRRLSDMLHIATPFRGELASERHVAELAGLLHPTPAVGGVPADGALTWLAEHEPDGRGWFAGPVGVIERSGDGELAVALRCALIAGLTLHAYAGAGIVAASDAAAEYEETEVKIRSCLDALGVDA